MRAITIMTTAAGALAAAFVFAPRANAERTYAARWAIKVGFRQSVCVDNDHQVFLDNADKGFFALFATGRPDAFLGR